MRSWYYNGGFSQLKKTKSTTQKFHLFTASISDGTQRYFEPLVLLVFDFGVAGQLLLVLPCEIFPERLELLLLLLVPLCPLLGQHGSVTVLLLLSHPLHLLHLVSLQLAYL